MVVVALGDLGPVGDENIGVDGAEAGGEVIAGGGVVFGRGAGADFALGDAPDRRDGDRSRRGDAVSGNGGRELAGHGVGAVGDVVEGGWILRLQRVKDVVSLALTAIFLARREP